ncbi:unnamed protein product, partial [Ectocarpus fasciculatus]
FVSINLPHGFLLLHSYHEPPRPPPPPPPPSSRSFFTPNSLFMSKVPGIAARGAEILGDGEGDDKVTNTYQLIGKFLALRGPDQTDHEVRVDSVEHCDKFWYWLQAKGINSNRSGIVNAIAEKVNTWIPGECDV